MRFTLATLVLVLAASCLPAMAQPLTGREIAAEGNAATVSGRAHIEEGAEGTYVQLERPGAAQSVAGFIPFGDKHAYPGLYDIEGREVAITGVMAADGGLLIMMTDPDQLAVLS